jgi:hypothetical protein
MSLLYLHFDSPERDGRVQKLSKGGGRVVVTEPRWPGFHEVAKKEKPSAVAIDFSLAPSHGLETADYLAKAKETRELPIYLLRVPDDRLDIVRRRLPQAHLVTEAELSEKLTEIEREAAEKARLKKEAAAEARKLARAKNAEAKAGSAAKAAAAAKGAAAGKGVPSAKGKKIAAKPPARKKPPAKAAKKPAPKGKRAARPPKKK